MLVISPAEGLIAVPEKTIAFGVAKLERFCILKHSARNCKVAFSEIAVFLKSERSIVARPGPR